MLDFKDSLPPFWTNRREYKCFPLLPSQLRHRFGVTIGWNVKMYSFSYCLLFYVLRQIKVTPMDCVNEIEEKTIFNFVCSPSYVGVLVFSTPCSPPKMDSKFTRTLSERRRYLSLQETARDPYTFIYFYKLDNAAAVAGRPFVRNRTCNYIRRPPWFLFIYYYLV